jgi:large subunit ribosomal protein L30
MSEKTIRITLRHSGIGRPPKHRRTLASMGLRKINQTIVRPDTPEIRGMIRQISHLLEVQE